jgi:regulator of sigma E protease
VLTILSTIVVLSILILVHEFGHFFAAKAVGIQVPRFSLGFGKRLWGFHWGETEFVLSAIPLGGYVKMAGMEDDEAAEALEGEGPVEEVDPERTFDSKPIWARMLVITAGVIMNFLFAILMYAALAQIYGETKVPAVVGGVDPGAPADVAALAAPIPMGAKVTAVGDRPVAHFRELAQALEAAPAGPVVLRLENAPPVTLQLPRSAEKRMILANTLTPRMPPVISAVEGGSPAQRAGLRADDRVVEAGGRPIRDWVELVAVIQQSAGKPLAMVVERGGQRLAVTATPKVVERRGPGGKTVRVGLLGARQPPGDVTHRRVNPAEALAIGVRETGSTTGLLLRTLKQLMTGELSARNMGGLLTIGEASGESARLGLSAFLSFLALFSVNLAVLNLLPIPILDGGHLMFLAIEAVRGRPLSIETRIRLSQLGLVMVVALMLWANGNDVVRLVERYLAR